jgi:hypothetical protein
MKKIMVVTSLTLVLQGCVAVWGQAHNVTQADETGFTVQYDKALTSTARTSKLAKEHCEKYGLVAEPVDAKMPGLLLGIIEERYNCVKKPPVASN